MGHLWHDDATGFCNSVFQFPFRTNDLASSHICTANPGTGLSHFGDHRAASVRQDYARPNYVPRQALRVDCGVTHKTIAAWLSVLEAGYVVFLLQPHHRNFGKRLVKTPKLYFHDTGLAAYLMGIADAGHLAIHSARGALFENWVISELLKQRYNQGLLSNLYFWRNNTGDEVDVLIEQGERLQPVEIKSGQTFHADFLSGLNKWTRYAGDAALPAQLVYGGDDNMRRDGATVHSWRNLQGLFSL